MRKKKWRVELSKPSIKYLKTIEIKKSQKILNALEELEKLDNPVLHQNIRPLLGKLKGYYRLRVADQRIIFELDTKAKRIGVHLIVHRGSAY
jgi:mRNA-degrading endonuclease RelE of RelBE toxin-antitoxin system